MRYTILALLLFAVPAFADGGSTEEQPVKVSVANPEPYPGALVGRSVEFGVPPEGGKAKTNEMSLSSLFSGLVAIPGWIIESALDLTAGTLTAGGQVLSVGTGTGLGVLKAGSQALVDTGEIVELGSNKMADRVAAETK